MEEGEQAEPDVGEDEEVWGAPCLPSGRHGKPRPSTLSWADGCSDSLQPPECERRI